MNHLEDRLREAFGAAAQAVTPESVGGLRPGPRVERTRRLAPLAAAAAVAVIVVGASVSVPLLLAGGHHSRPPSAGAVAPGPSAGPSSAAVKVPLVVGMTVNQAVATLQAAGANDEMVSGADNGVPPGTVIAQSPVGGTQVPRGSTVTITVAGLGSSATFTLAPPKVVTASEFAATIAIPANWTPTPGLGLVVGYNGADGWVQLRSAAYPAGVRAACSGIATGSPSRPYGANPEIEYQTIDGRPGCVIIPSHDAPAASQPPGGPPLPATAAVVEYRSPLSGGANFLVITADPPHLMGIIGSVQLHH